jgi:hypothetical protein
MQEGTMHIHGNSMAINAASFYSAAQNEKAAVEGLAGPQESLLIGQWMDSRHSQAQSEDAYRTAASGKDLDFG